MQPGSQPVIAVTGRTAAEAWQNAMLALHEHGCNTPTSFDRAGDPESKDATVIVTVEEPLAEPRLHKKAIPAGLEELEIYRLEVVAGVHDHWVNRFGDEWNYTYHERLRAYDVGLMRKQQDQRIRDRMSLRRVTDMEFIENRVREESACVNNLKERRRGLC